MSASYVVARAPGGPVIGLMNADQIRRQLSAGELHPSDVCVPANATGDLGHQWRPLSELFGDVPHPPGSATPPRRPRPPRRPVTSGPPSRPALEAVGELMAAVSCAVSAAVPCLLFASALGAGFGRPEVSPV